MAGRPGAPCIVGGRVFLLCLLRVVKSDVALQHECTRQVDSRTHKIVVVTGIQIAEKELHGSQIPFDGNGRESSWELWGWGGGALKPTIA